MGPQLTVSSRGVLVSWLEQADPDFSLKFAERSSGAWSAADDGRVQQGLVRQRCRRAPGHPHEGRHDRRQLVSGRGLQARGLRHPPLLLERRGQDVVGPLVPHHDKTRTQHGFVSMFEMPAGGLGLVWLDGRNQGKQPEDAEMALYFGSYDTSWKQTAEVAANARVCECCTTSAVVTSDGVVAAFRDRSAEEIRDIHVSRLENGKWTDAQIVHADNWEIDACPVNGPALSARDVRSPGVVHGKDDKGQALPPSRRCRPHLGHADQARR